MMQATAGAACGHGLAVVTKPVSCQGPLAAVPCEVGEAARVGSGCVRNAKGTWAVRRLSTPRVASVPQWSHLANGKARRRAHASDEEVEVVSIQELADGSIFFAFGAHTKEEFTSASAPDSLHSPPVAGSRSHLPSRRPSSFHKRSPITIAAARRGFPTNTPEASRSEITLDTVAVMVSISHVPRRWPSSFLKKSPIPYLVKRDVRAVVTPQATNSSLRHGEESNLVHTALTSHFGESNAFQTSISESTRHANEFEMSSLDNLNSYKLAELKTIAKNQGLKGYSKLKKGELIDLLKTPRK